MESDQTLAKIAAYQKKVTDEFEWKQSLETFTDSSDRGRYLMVVIVVAFFFCMICWLDSRQGSWIAGRVIHTRRAIQYQVWDPASPFRSKKSFPSLKAWAETYHLHSRELLMSYLSKLEEMEAQTAYSVRIPFVGISFDVNDLGTVVGLSFLFLTLVLLASTYREHENLYLCLWKVRKMFEAERKPNIGLSESNLLYHALAMAQVFTNPPTLGRWRRNRLYYLPYLIFFLPVLPESLILGNDLSTVDLGEALSTPATYVSLSIQVLCISLGLVVSVFCVLYERSSAIRWRSTFYLINPKYRNLEQPFVRDWLLLVRSRPTEGEPGADGILISAENKKVRLSAELSATRTALIFDGGDHLPHWNDKQLAERLEQFQTGRTIRIAVDGKHLGNDRFGATRKFLSKWRAKELAFAVVDQEMTITYLAWRSEIDTHGSQPERVEIAPPRDRAA
jgi:hypothetical protein